MEANILYLYQTDVNILYLYQTDVNMREENPGKNLGKTVCIHWSNLVVVA